MTRIALRYVVQDVDRHGNVRFYFRRSGQSKVRLPGLPGSESFMDAYQGALNGIQASKSKTPLLGRAEKGSLGFVCLAYYASPTFKALASSTQSWRRRALDTICEKFGNADISDVRPDHVRKWRNQLERAASRNRLKALKALFGWAVENAHLQVDPTIGVKPIKYSSEPHHRFTDDEIIQYERCHPIGTKARLALGLLLFTSWRCEDATRLGPEHIYVDRLPDGATQKRFKYRLKKNEFRSPSNMDIPVFPELEAIIDATPSNHQTFIVTHWGKPFSPKGFSNKFKQWCREANLPHCSTHGLRHAAAARLAEAGATEFEIMAITGLKSLADVERYTKQASMKKLATSGMSKLK